jgi:hypothetical protein
VKAGKTFPQALSTPRPATAKGDHVTNEREPTFKMVADGLREVGILIFVFSWIDPRSAQVDYAQTALVAAAGLATFFGGVLFERLRPIGKPPTDARPAEPTSVDDVPGDG